jgi:phosphoserine phosphatase RsbU/P
MPFSHIRVRQVMTPEPICLGPQAPIQEALDLMNHHRVGAILIINPQGELLGIFTDRDFLKRATSTGPGWRSLPIEEWMSPHPYTISPDTGWEDAMTSLHRLRVRHLPVVENDKVIGIVSARQLIGKRNDHLNQIIEERTRELKQANDQLLARDAELTHYMKVAARLQTRLVLPHSPPAWSQLCWGIHFAPLDPLGGDFYDFAQPDSDHLGILIADASGHSIPAAMVAVMARFAFQEIAPHTVHPGEVLGRMNERLQDLVDSRFVTAFYGIIHRDSCKFTYANAGHPFPLRYSVGNQETSTLSARGFPLGISPEEVYREKSIDLEPGDRLCLYTDGLPDICNDLGESFGQHQLSQYFTMYGQHPARILTDALVERLRVFQGDAKANDDLTLLVAEIFD